MAKLVSSAHGLSIGGRPASVRKAICSAMKNTAAAIIHLK